MASCPDCAPTCAQYLPPPQEYDENGNPIPQDEDMLQEHFEDFYEDIFEELTNIGGELEQLRAWYAPHEQAANAPFATRIGFTLVAQW